ncbi:HNH endonuclease signature motif containing protein [Actinosynnema sp. NPDC023587]|uniref:HNH endonuclease signature motif containing protein n=1 Tax=Actinosynnema sp. NPDC023587 TaxID=3154695 RepID=UPI0033E22525
MRTWAFLSVGDERHFQGNAGYPDVLESYYVYDSPVTYADKVEVGDLVFIRNRDWVLGSAVIQRIEVEHGAESVRRRCPGCGDASFKQRKKLKPRYLCLKCRNEFDHPTVEPLLVTRRIAHYETTWHAFEEPFAVVDLRRAAANESKQQSISPLKRSVLEELMAERLLELPEPPDTEAVDPSPGGGHQRRLVNVRNGQGQYRALLLAEFGESCAITGPCPKVALHAAHLRAFAVHKKHNVREGLLLRADIHQLFDAGQMAIDPASLTIRVAPELAGYSTYGDLEGRSPAIPVPVHDTLHDALRDHFVQASATWDS